MILNFFLSFYSALFTSKMLYKLYIFLDVYQSFNS